MGNYLNVIKIQWTTDSVSAVNADNWTKLEKWPTKSQTSGATDSNEHQNAPSRLERDLVETAASASNYEQNGSATTATMSDLPVEILAKIVRHFDIRQWKRLELVSKTFRVAVLLAWSELRSFRLESVFGYEFGTMHVSGQESARQLEMLRTFLETLIVRSPRIAEYKGPFYTGSQFSLLIIQQMCRFEELKRLQLYRLEHHVETVDWLDRTLALLSPAGSFGEFNAYYNEELSEAVEAALSRINLQELVYRSTSLDRGECLLQMNCEELTSLDLACSELDFEVIYQLLPRCKKLVRLNLSATMRQPVPLPENNFFTWLRTIKSLTSLKLNYFVDYDDSIYASDWQASLEQSLFELGSFEVLTELEMMDCWFCTDEMINVITSRLVNSLKVLRVDIDYCSEDSLLKLATRMVNLEELQFRCLDETLYYDDYSNITDGVVSAITANLSKLRNLDLGPLLVSVDSLMSLTKLKYLRKLSVVDAFNDDTLVTVASALGHQLTTLEVPGSSRISDEGILAAVKHLQHLHRLNLSSTKISDKSLTAVSRYCSELRTLGLIGCHHISSQGVRVVLDSCQKLEKLYLEDSAVNVSELVKCETTCRRLQQVCLFDSLCRRFLYPSPYFRDCGSTTVHWNWFYCSAC